MKRDLKLNMSHLDAISRKVQSYIDAMEAVELAARKFEQTIKDQDSDAYNKLSEQWETNVWKNEKILKYRLGVIKEMIDSYISDMTDYIAPENETAMMRVDRNDIWWNYKQIEGEAISFDWIVLDQEVEKIKQKYEPLLKDPENTIGGIGQSICDTADEKGVAYSSGYIVTEVVTALLADKGLDKLKNVAKTGKTADNVADINPSLTTRH